MKKEEGFSLMQIVMSVIILLILATVVGLFVLGYMKDARLASMKEDASAIQEAIQVEYGKIGELPVGELVELGDRNKEIVSEVITGGEDVSEGVCSSSMNGAVVSKDEFIVSKDGELHSGQLSVKESLVDGSFTSTSVKAYEIDEDKISDKLTNVGNLSRYLVLDCGYGSIGSVPVDSGKSKIDEDKMYEKVVSKTCTEVKSIGYECIETVDELKSISMDGRYALVNDLDLSGELEWSYLGSEGDPFTGELNGNGYVISNFSVEETSGDVEGLFGYVQESVFKNIEMANMKIENADTSPTGFVAVSNGGLVVDNSKVEGEVRAVQQFSGFVGSVESGEVKMDGVEFKGKLIDDSQEGYYGVGSLVGYTDGLVSIKNARVVSDIKGGYYVGGVVGEAYEMMEMQNIDLEIGMDAAGDIGGVIGYAPGANLNNIRVSGNVIGGDYVGGVIGEAYETLSVQNMDVEIDVKAVEDVGGIAGYVSQVDLSNIQVKGNVIGEDYVGGAIGDVYKTVAIQNMDVELGIEAGDNVGGVIGSQSDRMDVNGMRGNLKITANRTAGGLVGDISGDMNVNDIHLDVGVSVNEGIVGGLAGNVYGNTVLDYIEGKYTVESGKYEGRYTNEWESRLKDYSTAGGFVGEFAGGSMLVGNTGVVVNVEGLSDSVGGILGEGYGDVEINDSLIEATVSGEDSVGGLLGELTSYENNVVVVSTNVTADVSGVEGIGGLIGYTKSEVNLKDVEANTGVRGDYNVGGVIGYDRGDYTLIDELVVNSTLKVDKYDYKTIQVEKFGLIAGGRFGNSGGYTKVENSKVVGEVIGTELDSGEMTRPSKVGGLFGASGGVMEMLNNEVAADLEGHRYIGGVLGDYAGDIRVDGLSYSGSLNDYLTYYTTGSFGLFGGRLTIKDVGEYRNMDLEGEMMANVPKTLINSKKAGGFAGEYLEMDADFGSLGDLDSVLENIDIDVKIISDSTIGGMFGEIYTMANLDNVDLRADIIGKNYMGWVMGYTEKKDLISWENSEVDITITNDENDGRFCNEYGRSLFDHVSANREINIDKSDIKSVSNGITTSCY